MLRFMIPISIVVKILQQTGLIVHVGDALSPLMGLMGLPGEMGLVWASAMVGNIYGALIAYMQIMPTIEPMNVAQITTLATVVLMAHNFPIELMVTKKAGARIFPMFCVRFTFAFVSGVLIFWLYYFLGMHQNYPSAITTFFAGRENATLAIWALRELKTYGVLFLIITTLIVVLDILKRIGVIEKISAGLEPVLRFLGIGKDVIPITVVGMTLGLAYGGALIIKEVKERDLKKRDVFYALILMSLCHSIIEDSLLLMAIGASWTGVFVFRVLFALVVAYLFVKITSKLSDARMERLFYNP